MGQLFIILYHHLVGVSPKSNLLVFWHKGNYILSQHVKAGGLACTVEGLKVLPNICEGLLRVCGVPLGLVLAVEVVVVVLFPCLPRI